MRKFSLLAGILFCALATMAQSFTGTGGSIPGSSLTQTCFPITVSGVGPISTTTLGLAQVCLTITHPYTDELEIVLTAPDGTVVPLSIQNGGSGNNYTGTCFTATAATNIKFGTPPFAGTFLPEGYLGAVNNGQNANGTWRLCIQDRRDGTNAGVLNSWSLTFNNTPAPTPAPTQGCLTTLPSTSSCANATPVCDFRGLCGSTSGNTVQTWTGLTSGTCFGLQNNFFLKFVASASVATFSVVVPTNSIGGNYYAGGIQMIFFEGTCNAGPIVSHGCYPHILPSISASNQVTSVVTANALVPGNVYYLMIDGFNNDICTYTITPTAGVQILDVNPFNPTVCAGQSVNLTATGGNGAYTWSPATGLNTTVGPTVIATPPSTITYTLTSAGTSICPQTKTVMVNVTPPTSPVTGFSYASPACSTSGSVSPTLANGFTTGGTFSSTTGLTINATTGAINPATSTAGTYTVNYIVTASGCAGAGSGSAQIVITNTIVPVTGFSYVLPLCTNGGFAAPDTVAGFTTGGTFAASPAGLAINAATGVINLTSSTPGFYQVLYAVIPSGCVQTGGSLAFVTVAAGVTPVTNFTYPTPICANAANPSPTLPAGFTTGGVFSSTTGLNINGSTGVINLAASTTGTYAVTYITPVLGCRPADTSSFSITITPTITPVTGFTYSTPVCANAPNLSPAVSTGFTAGGVFSSTTGLSINGSSGLIDLSASTPGIYTVTYALTATGCQAAGNSTFSITINNTITPVTNFSYASPVCISGADPSPIPGTNFTTGGTYSSTIGLSINPSTGVIDASASTPGNYTITYSVTAVGCNLAGSSTAAITISGTTGPVTTFSYATPVCKNAADQSPITGTGFTAGGVYSSTTGLSINSVTGIIDIAASTAGAYTITYSVAATSCSVAASGTASITINNIVTPVTAFTYATPVCANATNQSPTLAAGFATGGGFSGSPGGVAISAATGIIDVSASMPGTYTITYTLPASGGCNLGGSSTFLFAITASTTPITGFTYTSPVCNNSGNQSPTLAAGFVPGGTFTSTTGLTIDANTGEINANTSTAGTYQVSYAVNANGCNPPGTTTTSVTINAPTTPTTGFSYASPVCPGTPNPSPMLSTGFAGGGNFSSTSGLSIAASTGVINLAASTAGTYTVTYSVPATGCFTSGTSSAQITLINSSAIITGFSYASPVCPNNAVLQLPILTPGFTTGGQFSGPAGLAVDPSSGAIDVLASTSASSFTVTYAVPATTCSPVASSTAVFTIDPVRALITSFSYNGPICTNATTSASPVLPVGFTTGGTFSSTTGLSINSATGAINASTSTPGNYQVTYTVTPGGCTGPGSNSANVTIVSPGAVVTAFSYTPNSVCSDATDPVFTATAGFSFGGVFSSTTGLSINSITGVIDLANSTPGTYAINYALPASGCTPAANSQSTITITANVAPVTAPVNYCQGATAVPLTAIGTGLMWYFSPSGGTGFMTAPTPSTASSSVSTFFVSSRNGSCESIRVPIVVTVTATPPAPLVMTPVLYCQNSTATALTATGINLLWYDNSTGGVGDATAPVPVTTTNGSTTFYVTSNDNGCESTRIPITVTVTTTPPTPTATEFLFYCQDQIVPALSAAGSNLLWYTAATGGTGSATAPTPPTTAPDVLSYYVSQTFGTCEGSRLRILVTINATPAAPVVVPVSPRCGPGQFTMGVTVTGVAKWYSNAALTNLLFTGSTYTANLAATTIFYVTNTIGACVSPVTEVTGTVLPSTPQVTGFSYSPATVCVNDPGPVPIPATGFTIGGIYSSTTGLSINSITGVVNPSLSTPGIYTVKYALGAASGCIAASSSTTPIRITTAAVPVTIFSYATPVCANAGNQSPTLVDTFTTGGVFSSTTGLNIDPATGVINVAASTPGNYTVSYLVAATSCAVAKTGTALIDINVAPATAPTFTSDTICGSGAVQLIASGPGIINWYSDQALTNLISTSDTFSPVIGSSVDFWVTASIGTCVSPAATVRAIVNPLPQMPRLPGDTLLCPGDKIVLRPGAYATYLWQDNSRLDSFVVTGPGLYSVVVTSGAGCSTSKSFTVQLSDVCNDIYFPGSFNPASLIVTNRTFGAIKNIFPVSDYRLLIYNRYGQVVFSTTDPAKQWDGTYKGKLQPLSNYIYYATYRYRGRGIRTKSGNVVLIR